MYTVDIKYLKDVRKMGSNEMPFELRSIDMNSRKCD